MREEWFNSVCGSEGVVVRREGEESFWWGRMSIAEGQPTHISVVQETEPDRREVLPCPPTPKGSSV